MKTLTSEAALAPVEPRVSERSRWWRAASDRRGRKATRHAAGTGAVAPPEVPAGAHVARASSLNTWPPRLILLGLLIPVAFGRWGSYISPAGGLVYLSDLLVAVGVVAAGLEALRVQRRVHLPKARSLPWLVLLVLLVCAVGLARASDMPLLVIRDLVPIAYLALIPVAAWAVRTVGPGTAFAWTRRALALHTAWVLPTLLGVFPLINVPLVGVPLFETRIDFDMLLLAATVAAYALDHRPSAGMRATVIIASTVALALAGSRAGLLAALVLVVVVVLVARPFRGATRAPMYVGLGLVALAPVIMLTPAFLAAPPSWARVVVRLIPSDDAAYGSALNTWDARVQAWRLLLEYTRADPTRWLFGSGFGSSPVIDSGAIEHLSGDPSVRAAHSFLVTWIAYLGVAGTATLVGVLAALFVRAVCNARRPSAPSALGLGLMTGLLVVAIPGVVFESPFGYQTFLLVTAFAMLRPEDLHGRRGLEDPPRPAAEAPADMSRWRLTDAPAEADREADPDGERPGQRRHRWAGVAARERGTHDWRR